MLQRQYTGRTKHVPFIPHLRGEERVGLQALRLNYQFHHAVEGAVVQHGPLAARKEVGDDALKQGEVHLQELWEVHVLQTRSHQHEIVTEYATLVDWRLQRVLAAIAVRE